MNVYTTTDKGHFVFVVAPDMDNAQTMVDASSRLRCIRAVPEDTKQGVYPLDSTWSQVSPPPITAADLIDEASAIYREDGLTAEQKYDLIFGLNVWQQIRASGYHFEWCDPDTSYEEDTEAYMQALREFREEGKHIEIT